MAVSVEDARLACFTFPSSSSSSSSSFVGPPIHGRREPRMGRSGVEQLKPTTDPSKVAGVVTSHVLPGDGETGGAESVGTKQGHLVVAKVSQRGEARPDYCCPK